MEQHRLAMRSLRRWLQTERENYLESMATGLERDAYLKAVGRVKQIDETAAKLDELLKHSDPD